MCLCPRGTVFGSFVTIQQRFHAFSPSLNKGNAVPMRSEGILTMRTAFPRVPPRNDHWFWVLYADFTVINQPSKSINIHNLYNNTSTELAAILTGKLIAGDMIWYDVKGGTISRYIILYVWLYGMHHSLVKPITSSKDVCYWQAFLPLLKKAASAAEADSHLSCSRAAIVNISSQMASIDDNKSGGGYGYRASKVLYQS